MKILDRKTFLEVPVGTLFMKVRACEVGPLQMFRGRAGPNDFIYRDLIEVDSESSDEFATIMFDACEHKTRNEIPLDWHLDMSRDGLYDDDQMFGVLTADEATQLVAVLTSASLPCKSGEGADHGLGPHATVVDDCEDGFMSVAIVVGENVYLAQGGEQITMSREQFAEIAKTSTDATQTREAELVAALREIAESGPFANPHAAKHVRIARAVLNARGGA